MKNLLFILGLTIGANAVALTCKTVDIKENKHYAILVSKKVKVELVKSYKKIYIDGDLYTQTNSYRDGTKIYKGTKGRVVGIKNGNIMLEPYGSQLMYLYSDCN